MIYKAPKINPLKGNRSELIKADFELIEQSLDELVIVKCEDDSYKRLLTIKPLNIFGVWCGI
jgi:hypothetical protein